MGLRSLGPRALPAAIAGALIFIGALGVGLILTQVLPDTTTARLTTSTGTDDAPPPTDESSQLPQAVATRLPTAGSSLPTRAAHPSVVASLSHSATPRPSPSLTPIATLTPSSTVVVPSPTKRHGRPWPKPTRH
jgi:hypothetical protein